jgi:hypothetical protein
MPFVLQIEGFKPVTESDATRLRQKWEQVLPELVDMLNQSKNRSACVSPSVHMIRVQVSVRKAKLQKKTFRRGGHTKSYDLTFTVLFEDGTKLERLWSPADVVRAVGLCWGKDGTFSEDVFKGEGRWRTARAFAMYVSRSTLGRKG